MNSVDFCPYRVTLDVAMVDDVPQPSDQADVATNEMTDAAAIQDRPLDDVLQQMITQSGGGLPDQIGYDPRSETYHARHDWDDSQPLSTTVIEAVGAATETDPTQMDPLYEVLEPSALDALFRPQSDAAPRMSGQVLFSLDGHDVAVHSCGSIIVDASGKERGGENTGVE